MKKIPAEKGDHESKVIGGHQRGGSLLDRLASKAFLRRWPMQKVRKWITGWLRGGGVPGRGTTKSKGAWEQRRAGEAEGRAGGEEGEDKTPLCELWRSSLRKLRGDLTRSVFNPQPPYPSSLQRGLNCRGWWPTTLGLTKPFHSSEDCIYDIYDVSSAWKIAILFHGKVFIPNVLIFFELHRGQCICSTIVCELKKVSLFCMWMHPWSSLHWAGTTLSMVSPAWPCDSPTPALGLGTGHSQSV